jgi:hypothetical protein
MAVVRKPVHKPRPGLPAVVKARDPKVIAREKAMSARLAITQPPVLRDQPATSGSMAATAAEIAEVLRFAGDATRPRDCLMARIAAERIIMHLETRGFVLVARDPKAPRGR